MRAGGGGWVVEQRFLLSEVIFFSGAREALGHAAVA
jgi:hypothetical protein